MNPDFVLSRSLHTCNIENNFSFSSLHFALLANGMDSEASATNHFDVVMEIGI